MDALETRLQRTVDMIEQRKKRLDLTQNQLSLASATPMSTIAKIFSLGGVIKSSQVRQIDDSISKLEDEINGLNRLNEQLKNDYNSSKFLHEQLTLSRTLKGKLWQFIGIIFSVYCLYRLITGSINVLFRSSEPYHMALDPVTKVLKRLELFKESDLMFWSQQISFVMVSVMIVLSIRSLLLNLHKVFQTFLKTVVSEKSMMLVFAQATGLYFLSSIVLLARRLPLKQRMSIADVLMMGGPAASTATSASSTSVAAAVADASGVDASITSTVEQVVEGAAATIVNAATTALTGDNSTNIDYYFRWFDSLFIVSVVISILVLVYFNKQKTSSSTLF